MKGDFQVRFCERLKLQCFGLLDRITDERHNLSSSFVSLFGDSPG